MLERILNVCRFIYANLLEDGCKFGFKKKEMDLRLFLDSLHSREETFGTQE